MLCTPWYSQLVVPSGKLGALTPKVGQVIDEGVGGGDGGGEGTGLAVGGPPGPTQILYWLAEQVRPVQLVQAARWRREQVYPGV